MANPACISRIVLDTLRFGDETHKFYTEARCNRQCIPNKDICLQCICKVATGLQHSRKFDHGKVNEPIPDHSHMYGGKWYHNACKKWNAPYEGDVGIAIEHHMAAVTNTVDPFIAVAAVKTVAVAAVAAVKTPVVAVSSKPRKNDVEESKNEIVAAPPNANALPHVTEEPKKKKAATKKVSPKKTAIKEHSETTASPYSSIIENNMNTVYKEVNFPTYIEKEMEEISIEDYEIEYVPISTIKVNSITYFRDAKKNKLYTRIKDKQVGEYVGRYNPATDIIYTDIPDSDEDE